MNPLSSVAPTSPRFSAPPPADLNRARRTAARTPPTKEELGRFATALRTFGASLSASPFESALRDAAAGKDPAPER
ncbi:MAG: hypothetical protein NTV51_17640 [Verrucomicrobia bacterium]|nr:hypothetical protein [Verrucomicrobiota bacterium]